MEVTRRKLCSHCHDCATEMRAKGLPLRAERLKAGFTHYARVTTEWWDRGGRGTRQDGRRRGELAV